MTTSIQRALQDENPNATHDVIGIVVKISIDSLHSKAQVLIADKTIPESAYARVSLQGSDTVTASLAEVSVGDVVHFHGFKVSKHDKLPLVADFHSSWQQPQSGWTRIHCHWEQQVSCQDELLTILAKELVEWFSTTKFNDSIPALPCRRRRLNELNTAGMTTHVVTRVASIDAVAAAPPHVGRRKRWLPLKKRRTIVAVLVDGNDVMPLLDCASHESILKQAIQSEGEVLLTNLITAAAEKESSRDIVLKPTDSTCIFPILNSTRASKRHRQAAASANETQYLSMTQPVASATQTISSPLIDVYIDELGVSLGDGKRFVSPTGFASTLVNQRNGDSPAHYREATLTLDDGIVVKADSVLMQTLCGSIDPDSLLRRARLRAHVTDLMRGLLEEQVALTWTLEQKGDTLHATKCVLPRL